MRWFLSLCLVGLLAPQAVADVTDFTVTPSNPVMGEEVWYAPVDNGSKWVISWLWQYRFTSGSCTQNWITGGTSRTVSFLESRPGTWDVRLTASYFGGGQAVITKAVTIAPATHVVITSGVNTPTPLGQTVKVVFRIKSGSKDCGTFMAGFAQEKLTNRWNLDPPISPTNPDDSDWDPALGTWDPNFYRSFHEIWDTKLTDMTPAAWAQISNDQAFNRFTQHLRLTYTDPCGDAQIIDLGSKDLERLKVQDTKWIIREQ